MIIYWCEIKAATSKKDGRIRCITVAHSTASTAEIPAFVGIRVTPHRRKNGGLNTIDQLFPN
ncbi:unnamed protein product, partial [Larinioides sclopetarius]